MEHTIQRKNERSWAIDIISKINAITKANNLKIKQAGGESTISLNRRRMFPDVLLYADEDMTVLLQGWELKMPDTAITDDMFVQDARRKAIALALDSFVIWNFTYAKLFVRKKESNLFEETNVWSLEFIETREDVALYRKEWEKTLEDVVLTVNEYLCTHTLRQTQIEEIVSDKAIDMLVNDNKSLVAEHLKNESTKNAVIGAGIHHWWLSIKAEYMLDETDEFKAYAKNIILNWAYKILFAHLIKRHHSIAMQINELDYNRSPKEANAIFLSITSHCDFFNIFYQLEWNELLPQETWKEIVEFSLFLKQTKIDSVNQTLLQNILEHSVNTTHREMNGQFTTPKILAELMAAITVLDWTDNVCDPCCGTGTIPRAIINIKKSLIGAHRAMETTWASDKYQLPLQIANIGMASYDTINLACRLFQKDALKLNVGETAELRNPTDGSLMVVNIPQFGAICSNLPFVSFENIDADDQQFINKIAIDENLNSKSDLSYYIAIRLADILKEDGRLGIITSNSWLATEAGRSFYSTITEKFNLLQVHISGKERWFKNADVVTTLLILEKRKKNETIRPLTSFFLWKKKLDEIENDNELKESIINSSLLDKVTDSSILDLSRYTLENIESLHNLNLSYNTLFYNLAWVLEIKDKLTPLNRIFTVIRGCRRGWDKLFFPKGENTIEDKFLIPVSLNTDNVEQLLTSPEDKAFCCGLPLEELKDKYPKAYAWIQKFSHLRNKKGRPLPEVLKRPNIKWYEMRPSEIVEIFTSINPYERIFFGRFKKPTFINQRLVGLNINDKEIDKELAHALLNTVLMQFFVESAGFGRGLGVLDLSKNHLAQCYMLNPYILTSKQAEDIKRAFAAVKTKRIMPVVENETDPDWQNFNHTVLRAYDIDQYYNKIWYSLKSMQSARLAVNKKKNI